jgi:hypothetical protein
MSAPLSPQDLKEIQDSILAGRMIEAIKLYRQHSGLGLKEAKDAVEEMERKLRVESREKFAVDEPEKKQEPSKGAKDIPGVQVGKGCFGMVAAIVLAAAILALLAAFGH